MGKDDYAATGGSLKLKGVKDGKVHKNKKKPKRKVDSAAPQDPPAALEDAPGESAADGGADQKKDGSLAQVEAPESAVELMSVGKTEAERKREEMRRQRLAEKLKREGVKTHKERVEELNKYLSNLSEHHDMPRIGPG
ncbi:MAG: hypothetical protein M1826_002084 [Phylliscum demangeonii]|nr:MAG: hypothetical protein M1826_002084 [Phylliscum demangeonii]